MKTEMVGIINPRGEMMLATLSEKLLWQAVCVDKDVSDRTIAMYKLKGFYVEPVRVEFHPKEAPSE